MVLTRNINKHTRKQTRPMIYLVNLNQEQFIKKRSKWLPKIQVRELFGLSLFAGAC